MGFVLYTLNHRPSHANQTYPPIPLQVLTTIPITVRLRIVESSIQLSAEAILLAYFKRRRKAKLYRQWVERAGLPPEAVPTEAGKSEDTTLQVPSSEAASPEVDRPLRVHVEPGRRVAIHPEVSGDMMAEINERQLRLPLLYMLLGASALILCVGLILLIVYSC